MHGSSVNYDCNNNNNDGCSRESSTDPMELDESPCSGGSCHDHDDHEDEDHWDYENYDFESTQDIDDEFKGAVQNIFPLVEQFTTRQFSDEMIVCARPAGEGSPHRVRVQGVP